MSKALDIQLAIYASIEIARSVAYALVFTGASLTASQKKTLRRFGLPGATGTA